MIAALSAMAQPRKSRFPSFIVGRSPTRY